MYPLTESVTPMLPEVFVRTCKTRQTLELIASKWTVLIIVALSCCPLRYGQIKRIVEGISHKMLAQTLRQLENDGLVSRTVYPLSPPQVEYALTPLGLSLSQAMDSLCIWGQQHYHEVEAARASQLDDLEEAEEWLVG